jgi:hypothetical protein
MKIECVWNNYPLLEIFFARENSHSVRPVVKNKVRPLASAQPAWLDGEERNSGEDGSWASL